MARFDDSLLKERLAVELPVAKGHLLTFNSSVPLLEEMVCQCLKNFLAQGFEQLLRSAVLSAPVWDEAEAAFCGFLDIRDAVSFVVFEWDRARKATARPPGQDGQPLLEGDGGEARDVEVTVEDLRQRQADGTGRVTLTYLARRHSFIPMGTDASLAEVVRVLGKVDRNRRVLAHRVPLVDESGDVVNILSQSSIVAYLAEHLHHLGAIARDSVGELNLVSEPCISVAHDETALHTLRVMDRNNLSGVAIVHAHTGKLLGNTSASDLRCFFMQASLELPVMEFMERGHAAAAARMYGAPMAAVGPSERGAVSCDEDDSLAKVLSLLATTGFHRVWTVDEDFRPTGVVSVSDICRLFATLCESL